MKSEGFTLIELLTTLAIVAILLSLATPSMASWVNQYRLRSAAFDLMGDLQLARSEAVKRGVRITINNMDGDWDTGWQTFIDSDEDGEFDSTETLLFQRDSYTDTVAISGNRYVARMISYVPTGETRLIGGGFQAGTITLCAGALDSATEVIISNVGRPRLQSVSATNC